MLSFTKVLSKSLEGLRRASEWLTNLKPTRGKRNPYSRPVSRKLRSLRLTSMNNWQRRMVEDNTYGSSFFPVHSIIDSMYGDRSQHLTGASDPRVADSVAYATEAIRSLFSPKSDRSTD